MSFLRIATDVKYLNASDALDFSTERSKRGIPNAAKTPMMMTTTDNSTSVNALRAVGRDTCCRREDV